MPPRTIRQWSIRGRDFIRNHVSQRSDTQNVRSISRTRPHFIEVGDCGHLRAGSKVAYEIRKLQQARHANRATGAEVFIAGILPSDC